jgi:hypothetical protein
MTKEEAIEILGPIAEALNVLTKKKKKKSSKAETPVESETPAETPAPVETPAPDPFEDDLFGSSEPTETYTAKDVKDLVTTWIHAADRPKGTAQQMFNSACGLSKLSEVTDDNATEVYLKLAPVFKI